MEINNEIAPSALSYYYDQMGRVFITKDKVYRAINKDYIEDTMQLLSSGLIAELEEKNLFPKTTVSDYNIEGYDLVLEHQKIDIISYPYEWGFSKLKSAALCILQINIVAQKYGYITQDCHPYNILFHNSKPVFIDFGSFVLKSKFGKDWIVNEFDTFYTLPLLAWQNNDTQLGQIILSSYPDDYTGYKYQFYKSHFTSLFWKNRYLESKFTGVSYNMSNQAFSHKLWSPKKKLLAKTSKGIQPLPFRKNFQQLENFIKNINYSGTSYWDTYLKDNIDHNSKEVKTTPRFDALIDQLSKLDIKSSCDMASNFGLFTYLLSEKIKLDHAICIDYDPRACEHMFSFLSAKLPKAETVYSNIIFPRQNIVSTPQAERFKSDVAIALAVTHHLILTQKIAIDVIFNKIAAYSKKYVCIEFMPLGLWHEGAAPPFPEWYNVTWFRQNFSDHFNLITELQTEENRIAFIGSIK